MPTAILSVHDKTDIVEFAKSLASLGWTLLASGGTAKLLRDNNINVTEVADYTKSPEILGGRVKTLHPKVHGGLLAVRDDPEHQRQVEANGIQYIDMVVVNLYPFRETVARENVRIEDAIENIDIGGPSMIRSASKNHERVTVVVDPDDYGALIEELDANHGQTSASLRFRCAR